MGRGDLVRVVERLGEPQQQAQLVEVQVHPVEQPRPAAGERGLGQALQARHRDRLNPVPEQELLPAGEAFQGGNQPQGQPVHRFQRRAAPARALFRAFRAGGHRGGRPGRAAPASQGISWRRSPFMNGWASPGPMGRPGHPRPGPAPVIPAPGAKKIDRGAGAPRPPQGAKTPGFKAQSSVLATRKPMRMSRSPVEYLRRFAERRFPGSLSHEPPRNTRRSQSPLNHALPSVGARL